MCMPIVIILNVPHFFATTENQANVINGFTFIILILLLQMTDWGSGKLQPRFGNKSDSPN